MPKAPITPPVAPFSAAVAAAMARDLLGANLAPFGLSQFQQPLMRPSPFAQLIQSQLLAARLQERFSIRSF